MQAGEAVFVAQGRLASAARRNAESWRRRSLVSAEPEEVRTLRISRAGESAYSLVRSKDGGSASWTLADGIQPPPGFELDSERAGRIVSGLARLRADGFQDDDPGDETTGLGESATQVEALNGSGESLVVARFGAPESPGRGCMFQ